MYKFSKFSVTLALAASLASTASANWYDGVFVGAEGKYNLKSELETSWNIPLASLSQSINADESSFGLGLKVGYDFDFMRVYGAYNYNPETKTTYTVPAPFMYPPTLIEGQLKHSGNDFILGADWTPKFSLAGLDFKGILGAFAGISKIDVEHYFNASNTPMGPGSYYKMDYSQDGVIYGIKLGAIYDLNKFGEVEFGFKFDSAKYDDIDTVFFQYDANINASLTHQAKITNAKRKNMGLFVGYNYKF